MLYTTAVRVLLRIILLPFLFLALQSNDASAQLYYFNHYQVESGLTNNSVLCSAQDKNGFMWFGTRNGLNRFDGYKFKHFFADPENATALGSNFIHSLTIDRHNNMWVGTDQGLYVFDPRTEQFRYLKELRKREILQVEEDRMGNIWLVATNELFCYNPQQDKFTRKTFHRDYLVSDFCFDKDGQLWVGAGKNLLSLGTNKTYALPISSQRPTDIKKLFMDEQGDIWIGTSSEGLFRFDVRSQRIEQAIAPSGPIGTLYVRDILQVDPHSLWVATEGGLYIYDRKEHQFVLLQNEEDNPWSLTDNALYTLTKDHQGGVWIGTYFGGIHYYHRQHAYFEKIFPRFNGNSPHGRAMREMVEDREHNLWIGTEDRGLVIWDRKENSVAAFDQNAMLSHSNIHGLGVAGDSLFVGTFHQGMNVVDLRSRKVIKHFNSKNTNGALGNNFVYSITTTRAGRVLLATARGIYEFFPGQDQFRAVSNIKQHIFYTSIYEDSKQNLWFTTWRNGLFKLSPDGDLLHFAAEAGNPRSLNGSRVNRVFEDSDGKIWIATESGIAILKPGADTFDRITKKDGMPSDLILGFEEDEQRNLWISTSHGLVKTPISSRKIKLFDTEMGLLGLQFNYNSVYKDQQGYLYFGSSRGLIRFNPQLTDTYLQKDIRSPIYITGIQTHQRELLHNGKEGHLSRSVIYTDSLVLNYDESTISIDFAALNYVSAKSTSYRFRLLGLDSAWTLVRTNRKAYFTKIPPGNYIFHVVAMDASGAAISNQKQLHIKIRPPLWASTSAYILYTLCAIVLICYIFYAYDRYVKEKNRRRLEVIKNHKEQELYRAKMDFFTEITHEIKTPLTLIKGPLDKLIGGKGDETKTVKWLHTMKRNTDKLINLTENLLDFRKVESDQFSLQMKPHQISKVLQLCLSEFMPLAENRQLQVTTTLDTHIEANIDIETVDKILSNLLFNAFKYADQTINVLLYQNTEGNAFCVEIQNDGTLLSEEDAEQIFKPFQRASPHYRIKGSGLGLALAHTFASLHGGALFYVKNSKKLNIFVLEIPI